MTAANNTDPTVGAAVWASGSQVCSGHIGTLTANPRNSAANTQAPKVPVNTPICPMSAKTNMSNVCGSLLKYSARNPNSMNTEPNSVNKKNLIEEYRRVSTSRLNPGTRILVRSPQIPIMKYIGSSTSSKKMKNSTRSRATKVPFIPVANTRINARKALGLCGSGKCFHEYTIASKVMKVERTSIGRLIPSIPMWNLEPMDGIQVRSVPSWNFSVTSKSKANKTPTDNPNEASTKPSDTNLVARS